MKVFTYLALLGGAAAVRLMSHHAITRQPTPMHNVLVQLNQSEDWPELDEEQMQEIEDWVRSEIGEDGTGTITKDEAHAALQHFADSHGFEVTEEMWQEANMAFDYVDTNGDGELDLNEIMHAVDEHHGSGSDSEGSGPDGEHEGGKKHKKDKKPKKEKKDIQLKKVLVQLKQSEDWPELDSDQEDEIEEWVKSEIGKDGKGTITKDEAAAALAGFAEKHGFEITKEMWKEAEMAFDYVDTNGDGELDLKEIMKVVEEHEGKGKKDHKKDKKEHKDIQMKKAFAQLRQSEDWPELDSDQEDEIEEWVKSEIGKDGKGTITKDEAAAALAGFAEKHGFEITKEMWKEAEMAFDYVDTNGDGELDLKEIMKVVEEHEGKGKKDHKKDKKEHKDIQMKKAFAQLRQSEDWPELDSDQEDEIEEWVKSEIGKDGKGTITKDEAAAALAGFAEKHGFEITKEMWKEAEMAFDYVDTNGDGELDLKEIMKVVEEHEGKGKKDHKKEKKDIQMKKVLVQLRQSEDWPELSEEQEKEIEDWVKSEIGDGTGTITKEEAAAALSHFAEKHGFEITEEMWKEAEMAFDYVDTNKDGQLDLDEILKVVEEHGDKDKKGKKGKKGKKDKKPKKEKKDIQLRKKGKKPKPAAE